MDRSCCFAVEIKDSIWVGCDQSDPQLYRSVLESLLDSWGVWNGKPVEEWQAKEILGEVALIDERMD